MVLCVCVLNGYYGGVLRAVLHAKMCISLHRVLQLCLHGRVVIL